MRNRIVYILLFLTLTLQAFSLEIRVNGLGWKVYSSDDLLNLSFTNNDSVVVNLEDIIPIMEYYTQLTASTNNDLAQFQGQNLSSSITMAYLEFKNNNWYLIINGHSYQNPNILNIEGTVLTEDSLIVWLDDSYEHFQNELRTFGTLHQIDLDIQIKENLSQDLSRAELSRTDSPDLVIFNGFNFNSIAPFLSEVNINQLANVRTQLFSQLYFNNQFKAVPIQFSALALYAEYQTVISMAIHTLLLDLPYETQLAIDNNCKGVQLLFLSEFEASYPLYTEAFISGFGTMAHWILNNEIRLLENGIINSNDFILTSTRNNLVSSFYPISSYDIFETNVLEVIAAGRPLSSSSLLAEKVQNYLITESTQNRIIPEREGFFPVLYSSTLSETSIYFALFNSFWNEEDPIVLAFDKNKTDIINYYQEITPVALTGEMDLGILNRKLLEMLGE